MIKGSKIGEGSYGIVYSATMAPKTRRPSRSARSLLPEEPTQSVQLAVKRNLVDDAVDFSGTVRELDILNRVRDHPFFVNTVDIRIGNPFTQGFLSPIKGKDRKGQKDDKFHFVMQREQMDLHTMLYDHSPRQKDLYRVMVQCLLAVEYLHALRIVHRDIKPSNILITAGYDAKLCDFGLAKPYTIQSVMTPRAISPWYRCPEATLKDSYGYGADVWSLGCVFLEMLSCQALFYNLKTESKIIARMLKTCVVPREYIAEKYPEVLHLYTEPVINSTAVLMSLVKRTGKGNFPGLHELCSLISRMLAFIPSERITVTEAIESVLGIPAFSEFKHLVEDTRRLFNPLTVYQPSLALVTPCVEREWAYDIGREIYHLRDRIPWYSHRILFQSLDIFDRYLAYEYKTVNSNAVETAERGKLHTRDETEQRLVLCIYLAIKYFTIMETSISYDSVATVVNDKIMMESDEFETHLIFDVLECSIYRDTLYEASEDLLDDDEVLQLLLLMKKVKDIDHVSYPRIMRIYREGREGRQTKKRAVIRVSRHV